MRIGRKLLLFFSGRPVQPAVAGGADGARSFAAFSADERPAFLADIAVRRIALSAAYPANRTVHFTASFPSEKYVPAASFLCRDLPSSRNIFLCRWKNPTVTYTRPVFAALKGL